MALAHRYSRKVKLCVLTRLVQVRCGLHSVRQGLDVTTHGLIRVLTWHASGGICCQTFD